MHPAQTAPARFQQGLQRPCGLNQCRLVRVADADGRAVCLWDMPPLFSLLLPHPRLRMHPAQTAPLGLLIHRLAGEQKCRLRGSTAESCRRQQILRRGAILQINRWWVWLQRLVLSAEAGNGRHHWLRSRYPTFPALWEFCLYPCLEPRPNSSKIAESPFLTWNCESGPILQPRAKRQARSRASSPSRRQSLQHHRPHPINIL